MKLIAFPLIALLFCSASLLAQNVGIGTNLPAQKLDVEGWVELGDQTMGVAGTAGSIRYNNALGCIEYYHGGVWQCIGGGANTLDMAYDEGGPGAGRIITADAGLVEIQGPDGLFVVSRANGTRVQSGLFQGTTTTGFTADINTYIGDVGTSGANVVARGVFADARITQATATYDGVYGVIGSIRHPSGGTINLTGTGVGSVNKAAAVAGSLSNAFSASGEGGDVCAAVYGATGMHNSGGGSVTGTDFKAYAGLFQGNGRMVGLWGENSCFVELIPEWQYRDYHAGIIGFYNSSANGGNSGGSTGVRDAYFSIEANIDDTQMDDVVIQDRTTNGNVGIGTNSPAFKLHVDGTAGKPGGGNWATASDARLKSNIQSYNKGLDLVLKVKPVSFQYNGQAGIDDTDRVHVGVIAQDLQQVAPQMVEPYSFTNHETGETQEYLSVNTSELEFAQLNAIKELNAKLEKLAEENAALRQRLELLEHKSGNMTAKE